MALPGLDLRLALRSLSRSPAFTLIAVVTIGLGIGASTAIFTVVNAVLLRPLPYAEADRLITIWADMRARNVVDFPFAPADFHDLREQVDLLEEVAAVTLPFRPPLIEPGVTAEQVRTMGATPNLFRFLGARVALGRDFTEADGTPPPPPPEAGQDQGAQAAPPPQAAILGHDFWQRRFGGDPGVIGRLLELGGQSVGVVGVLAPGVELLLPPSTGMESEPDIWTAMRVDFSAGSRINVFLRVLARLRPGVTLEQAQAQLDVLAAQLREQFPVKQTAGVYFRAERMHEDLIADVRAVILALMGAVLFVLLIACANVANLLLVRAASRERELAVRAALGGGRWRLIRQMLMESVVLAACGALLGLVLAQLGVDLLMRLRPADLPRIENVTIDPTVLTFTALAALVAAALFGIVPAVRASRPDLNGILRESGRTPGLRGGRLLRNTVVTVEVALSFVLLIGSGLMVRSFLALVRTDPGFRPEGVMTFRLSAPFRPPAQRETMVRQTAAALAGLPGVRAVTAGSMVPLDGQVASVRWGPLSAAADPNQFQQATFYAVLPGWFSTLGTRLIAGRDFTDEDNRPEATVAIIDARMAERAFPGESAIGKQLLFRFRSDEPEPLEIIGVVAHQRHTSLAADGRETVYVTNGMTNHAQAVNWVVRTDGNPASLAGPIRDRMAQLDPEAAVAQLMPLDGYVERARAPTRFALVLIGVFAAVAVLLAAVGLYGVLSTLVRQRTAEIGVRMAFGAGETSIFRLVIGHGLRLSAGGIVFGVLAALALTRVLGSLLVGVTPTDPLTFATTSIGFFLVAAFACFLPARRAARLEPTAALREE